MMVPSLPFATLTQCPLSAAQSAQERLRAALGPSGRGKGGSAPHGAHDGSTARSGGPQLTPVAVLSGAGQGGHFGRYQT